MKSNLVLKKIKGDASFRNFYRKRSKDKTSIIVFAKKEKQKNLIIYDAINKILNKNQILAPKLYSYKYNKNFIEIQDFGNKTIFALVKKESEKSFFYFKKIIKELNKIQAIKDKKIKTFQNKLASFTKIFFSYFGIVYVLRNLKVIGVFTRLAIRDRKKKYLKLIPYTWSLIKMRIKENKNFKELNDLLKQFFKDKMT